MTMSVRPLETCKSPRQEVGWPPGAGGGKGGWSVSEDRAQPEEMRKLEVVVAVQHKDILNVTELHAGVRVILNLLYFVCFTTS